jgi:uncharacterized protein
MSKAICIYHGNCADGFTAAWAVRKALGDQVEFFPGVYGHPFPDVQGRDVLMVDFSYSRETIDLMAMQANSILILDHHKTAEAALAPFAITECGGGRFVYADLGSVWRDLEELKRPMIAALFDMERSGAGIAWDFFHPNTPRPNLIKYVEDRDLWRFKLAWSREVNAYVFAHDYTFKDWDHLDAVTSYPLSVQHVADMGGAIEKKHHKDIAELLRLAKRRLQIGGHDVPAASLPYTMASDAGNVMAQGERFAACYYDTPEARVFSLRSAPDGLDVSAIATSYGGGGHQHAAGFQVPRDHALARA